MGNRFSNHHAYYIGGIIMFGLGFKVTGVVLYVMGVLTFINYTLNGDE